MEVELPEKNDKAKAVPEPAKEELPPVSISKLFSSADFLDYVYMTIGLLAALGSGVSMPAFSVLFGMMLDNINGNPEKFDKTVANTAIAFAIVGGINLFIGALEVSLVNNMNDVLLTLWWSQVYCFTAAAERQAQRLRELYVNAILRQEIGWFDKNGAAELAPKVADICGKVCLTIFMFNIVANC
jgi:ATP-binding cassette subfamily B (MDR/TAP) protein 1